MSLDERFRELEDRLAARKAEATRELDARLSGARETVRKKLAEAGLIEVETPSGARQVPFAPPGPVAQRVDLGEKQSLRELDAIMDADFGIGDFFGGGMTSHPTVYCETVAEYLEPILAEIPITDAARDDLLAAIVDAAESGSVPAVLMSLGMHLPGIGCYVNGWYMGKRAGMAPLAWFETDKGFAQVVTTAAHEKWGHGFISELTASGAEKTAVKLGMHHLADDFDISDVDTPDHARLSEQWRILFMSSHYVEEGYATWIERYLAERIAQTSDRGADFLRNAPGFLLDAVLERVYDAPGGKACAQALRNLFEPDEINLNSIHAAMGNAIHAIDAMGDAFVRACGMPAPYVVGFCMVNQIAQRQGPKCIPYAVATACNVQYDLTDISNHDLANYVSNYPNLNVNTRLALLMFLPDGTPNDVDGFLARIPDEAGIRPPAAE